MLTALAYGILGGFCLGIVILVAIVVWCVRKGGNK